MITKDESEIWYWHQRIEEFKVSGLGQRGYCKSYNVEYKRFCNMLYRIEYKKLTNPKEYARIIPIGRDCQKSGMSAAAYSKANNLKKSLVSEVVTHLNYLDVVERLKAENYQSIPKPSAMRFVQIPPVTGAAIASLQAPEAQVIEPQNDIEITIAKGVKVLISPNIDPMKIIKIIELLKDL